MRGAMAHLCRGDDLRRWLENSPRALDLGVLAISDDQRTVQQIIMKITGAFALAFLASVISASPTQSLEKRAAVTDVCNIGYCTQNGGYVRDSHYPG